MSVRLPAGRRRPSEWRSWAAVNCHTGSGRSVLRRPEFKCGLRNDGANPLARWFAVWLIKVGTVPWATSRPLTIPARHAGTTTARGPLLHRPVMGCCATSWRRRRAVRRRGDDVGRWAGVATVAVVVSSFAALNGCPGPGRFRWPRHDGRWHQFTPNAGAPGLMVSLGFVGAADRAERRRLAAVFELSSLSTTAAWWRTCSARSPKRSVPFAVSGGCASGRSRRSPSSLRLIPVGRLRVGATAMWTSVFLALPLRRAGTKGRAQSR